MNEADAIETIEEMSRLLAELDDEADELLGNIRQLQREIEQVRHEQEPLHRKLEAARADVADTEAIRTRQLNLFGPTGEPDAGEPGAG